MKTLLILRHAKSSWGSQYLADHDRPLNSRGERDAPRMGRWLRAQELTPDLIITSSAVRARTTADAVGHACGYESTIQFTRQLFHAPQEAYRAVLRQVALDEAIVMVVGHNPGMEDLVEELTGHYERMPTAALAQVRLDIDAWSELTDELTGMLIDLWCPKELSQDFF